MKREREAIDTRTLYEDLGALTQKAPNTSLYANNRLPTRHQTRAKHQSKVLTVSSDFFLRQSSRTSARIDCDTMAILRHCRRDMTLSRLATLWTTTTLACVFVLWIASPFTAPPDDNDRPSFAADRRLTRRADEVQSITQLAEWINQEKMWPVLILPRKKLGSKAPSFKIAYTDDKGKKRQSKLAEPRSVVTRVTEQTFLGQTVDQRPVTQVPTLGDIPQGEAYFGSLETQSIYRDTYTSEKCLERLFEPGPDEKFIHPAFVVKPGFVERGVLKENKEALAQIVIPAPDTTLAGLFFSDDYTADKEEIRKHMLGLFRGVQYILEKGLWSLNIQPDSVF